MRYASGIGIHSATISHSVDTTLIEDAFCSPDSSAYCIATDGFSAPTTGWAIKVSCCTARDISKAKQ